MVVDYHTPVSGGGLNFKNYTLEKEEKDTKGKKGRKEKIKSKTVHFIFDK